MNYIENTMIINKAGSMRKHEIVITLFTPHLSGFNMMQVISQTHGFWRKDFIYGSPLDTAALKTGSFSVGRLSPLGRRSQ